MVSLATPNQQHPPIHHEGWMDGWMDGTWSAKCFQLGSSSLANHGHYAQLHFLLPTYT
jgi:hypothetical protein